MPFVTPIARRYLHLSNTSKLDYSPNHSIVTENPSVPGEAVNGFGTRGRDHGVLNLTRPARRVQAGINLIRLKYDVIT